MLVLLPATGIAAVCVQDPEPEDQRPPTSRPVEVVRVIRAEAVEGGRTMNDVANRSSVMPHPAHRAWAGWGVGTRVVARTDEIDAAGRTFPVRREVRRLDAIDGEAAHISVFPIRGDGTAEEPSRLAIPAQAERGWIVLSRQGPQLLYWRRYEARVAFEIASMQPAGNEQSSRRPRRARGAGAGLDGGEQSDQALPPEFDCAIVETVHLLVEDDAANDQPELARPGDPLTVVRSYHNVEAPGWEAIVETYRARLGNDGLATDFEPVWRWRIERILRPGQPDPTPEQLRDGLPLGG